MAAFAGELGAVVPGRARGGRSRESAATVVLLPPAPGGPPRARRRRWPWYALGAVVLALVAATVAVTLALRTSGGHPRLPAECRTRGGGAPAAPLRLLAVRSYDPFGNNHIENPQLVPYATDGKDSTYWATEDYYDKTLGKPGVGIILAARTRRWRRRR